MSQTSVTLQIDRNRALRGSGPAPRGYIKCLARPWSSCPFSRDFSGRFTRVGTHYHPLYRSDDPEYAPYNREDQ